MRDLLIDYLVRHDAERHRFLESCSIAGLLLAISSAGGVSGERRFPLLQSPSDWDTLSERAAEIVGDADASGRAAILGAFAEAHQEDDASPLKHQDRQSLRDVTASVLSTVRQCWYVLDAPIEAPRLQEYVELSLRVEPLPAMPDMSRTWQHWAPSDPTDAHEQSWNDLGTWAVLIRLIQESEPRFLRQIAYPDEYVDTLVAVYDAFDVFLESLRTLEDPNPFDEPPDPEDPYAGDYEDSEEDEESELGDALQALERFEYLWPTKELADRATKLYDRMELQRWLREERTSEYQARTRPEPDDDDRSVGYTDRSGFDIAAVFSDL